MESVRAMTPLVLPIPPAYKAGSQGNTLLGPGLGRSPTLDAILGSCRHGGQWEERCLLWGEKSLHRLRKYCLHDIGHWYAYFSFTLQEWDRAAKAKIKYADEDLRKALQVASTLMNPHYFYFRQRTRLCGQSARGCTLGGGCRTFS